MGILLPDDPYPRDDELEQYRPDPLNIEIWVGDEAEASNIQQHTIASSVDSTSAADPKAKGKAKAAAASSPASSPKAKASSMSINPNRKKRDMLESDTRFRELFSRNRAKEKLEEEHFMVEPWCTELANIVHEIHVLDEHRWTSHLLQYGEDGPPPGGTNEGEDFLNYTKTAAKAKKKAKAKAANAKKEAASSSSTTKKKVTIDGAVVSDSSSSSSSSSSSDEDGNKKPRPKKAVSKRKPKPKPKPPSSSSSSSDDEKLAAMIYAGSVRPLPPGLQPISTGASAVAELMYVYTLVICFRNNHNFIFKFFFYLNKINQCCERPMYKSNEGLSPAHDLSLFIIILRKRNAYA